MSHLQHLTSVAPKPTSSPASNVKLEKMPATKGPMDSEQVMSPDRSTETKVKTEGMSATKGLIDSEQAMSPDRNPKTEIKPETPAKGIKRERSPSPSSPPIVSSQDISTQSASATPSRAAKKAKVQKTASEKAEESAIKATKAEAAKGEKARKATEKQGKQDWKDWFNAPANKVDATFQRTQGDDLVNVKESGNVYGIKREELNCLRHCPAPNPHGANFTPMKLFVKSEVQKLAFRKEAILAGVAQDDEAELLRRGKELYEEKHG